MAKRKLETSTAQPVTPPVAARVEKTDPVHALLGVLYRMAADDGNTTAAKIYLDYTLKQKGENTDALTPEEALRILREQRT